MMSSHSRSDQFESRKFSERGPRQDQREGGFRGGFKGNKFQRDQSQAVALQHNGTVNVASNQFTFKIAPHQVVHQYLIEIQPDDFFENDRYIQILM